MSADTDTGFRVVRGFSDFRQDPALAVVPELAKLSASELVSAYRQRRLSPVEVAEATVKSIQDNQAAVNAFAWFEPDAVLRQARASEARWLQNSPAGLVDGVPTSIKDLVLMRGTPTLRGSRTVNRDQMWDSDAPSTARLREHGAVLLGKTTTPEFGWRGTTDNTLTGITRNPLNLSKTSGGSSGGASSALAAFQGALAIGTDGGGSIRIPCGFTGTVGIKAHFGRVPAYPASPMGTVAHVGPMTRTVMDNALMLQVISQPDARDWMALPAHTMNFTDFVSRGKTVQQGCLPLKGLRIAYSPRLGYVPFVHPAIEAAVRVAAKDFEAAGASVEQIDPPITDSREIFSILWMTAARQVIYRLPSEQYDLIDPGLRAATENAAKYSLSDVLDAQAQRAQMAIAMRQFNQKYDLLLTPTLAVAPFEAGLIVPDVPETQAQSAQNAPYDWTWWTPFSFPFNLTQTPAISIPCGKFEGGRSDGLPISLQLAAANHREDLCYLAAAAFEAMA